MVWCLWGSKGGAGCSVMAVSAALVHARRRPVLLVDLAGGDLARILGVEPSGPGLFRWLHHRNPPPDALARLEQPVADGVALLPFRGATAPAASGSATNPGGGGAVGNGEVVVDTDVDIDERLRLLAHLLAAEERLVVVDLGVQNSVRSPAEPATVAGSAFAALAEVAARSTLVTRLCYLALTAAAALPVPDEVIVVAEPDRALRPADVAAALGVPTTTVRWDPAVARAVDSGLLTRRLPRTLRNVLTVPAAPTSPPAPRPVTSAAVVSPTSGYGRPRSPGHR